MTQSEAPILQELPRGFRVDGGQFLALSGLDHLRRLPEGAGLPPINLAGQG